MPPRLLWQLLMLPPQLRQLRLQLLRLQLAELQCLLRKATQQAWPAEGFGITYMTALIALRRNEIARMEITTMDAH